MKLNYNNISCKPDFTNNKCLNCIFCIKTCYTLCEHYDFCVFIKTNGDIFNENIL